MTEGASPARWPRTTRPRASRVACVAAFACAALACAALAPTSAHAQASDTRPLIVFIGPLTGDYAGLGERAWQSIVMVAAQTGEARLLHFDTAATTPEDALAAALAENPAAIIGPIGEQEARTVAAAADPMGPPIFLLTGADGIETAGDHVFRMRTSPADQAEALAGIVLAQDPGLTFGVLAPDDAYGDEAARAFVRAAHEYGGSVLRVARYESGEPDASEAVEELAGQRALRLETPANPWRDPPSSRLRSSGGDRTRPDAVFIPDYADQVSSILPHLAFQGWIGGLGSESVTLLGLGGWAADALQPAGDLAGSALILQVYSADDLRGPAEGFALEWRVRHDEEPTAFEAQVFDAASFAFAAVERARANGTDIVDEAFALEHAGVCGDMWLDDEGGVVRQLGLWQVDGAGLAFPVGRIQPPRPTRDL